MERVVYEHHNCRTSKSPRRIQADGGGGGSYAAMLVRRAQQTFDATASVAQSIMAQVSAFARLVKRLNHSTNLLKSDVWIQPVTQSRYRFIYEDPILPALLDVVERADDFPLVINIRDPPEHFHAIPLVSALAVSRRAGLTGHHDAAVLVNVCV